MSVNPQETPAQNQETPKQNDKEYNFAQIRAQLERERQEKELLRQELDKTRMIANERLSATREEEEDDSEPYVDHKRLEKKLATFGAKAKQETDERINTAVQKALSEERKNMWLKTNPDFYDVMQHAQTFADKDPELAETILSMPEGFERQKLVYKNIKALGLHKKEEPKSTIQDKIDQNRRTAFYQPSGTGTAPYGIFSSGKDWSPSEGKNAYQKMKELQSKLRIG